MRKDKMSEDVGPTPQPARGRSRSQKSDKAVYDVVIVGAGPAGLSAALVLGRACRSVLLCDRGTPRSWASKAMYGFLSRDGVAPTQFRAIARTELRRYANVEYIAAEVTAARRLRSGHFSVRVGDSRVRCRKLLLATGLMDQLPEIAGIERFFGKSVFQCPYCDGWELRNRPVAVYGRGNRGLEIGRALTAWSNDVALCTDGQATLSGGDRLKLQQNNIRIFEQRISRLAGPRGRLERIEFEDGTSLARVALFFDTGSTPQSHFAESLGCKLNARGGIRCGRYEATDVEGLYVAGNITRDVQLSIVAAAEGARAAFGINRSLTRERFELNATGKAVIEHPGTADNPLE
jgi:thioredoxin reductase